MKKGKCYQDTNLEDSYSQSVTYDNEKETHTFMEFLRACNHDTDYTYVLCRFLQSV